MVDIGTGIAIASVCAPITVALIKFAPQKSGNGNGKYVAEKLCDERSGNIKQDIKRVEDKLDRLLDFHKIKRED